MPLLDQKERLLALHTQRSFIVHAPAGSGKTELLIQRYLSLLAESKAPESVLALTFTRKAANEMKERVLSILHFSCTATMPPKDSYLYHRWQLGRKAYIWQEKQGWQLLSNSHLLRIQTIDAFYAHLIRRAPLQAQWVATAELLENPEGLYQVAIQRLFVELERNSSLSAALSQLMQHVNNDRSQLERLLLNLLGNRDQWISLIPKESGDLHLLRPLLEEGLLKIREKLYQDAEQAFLKCGVTAWYTELTSLLRQTAVLKDKDISSALFWEGLSDLLLTTQGEWRKIPIMKPFGHHTVAMQQTLKKLFKKWLIVLSDQDEPRLALVAIRSAPSPQYQDNQWDILTQLFYVLNALVRLLDVVFEQAHQVDYIGIALKASQLLGDAEDVTQLLLQLDYQIQHILIDEFQDTSRQQLQFLQRLTEGWQPCDGRTLFLVGDPMQSIYRFRKAEAHLFQKVQKEGLGTIELETITLCTNFRSSPSIVDWVNQQFAHSTDSQDYNDNFFTPAVATDHTSAQWSSVENGWILKGEAHQEATQVVTWVKQTLEQISNDPTFSIAILGRARQHLLPILSKLRLEHIPFQAVEIEMLSDKPMIQDLQALARALVSISDEIAWLAILRAPWCGASLKELQILMQACQSYQPRRSIWEQLQHLEVLALNESARPRFDDFVQTITPMMENYGRVSLVDRVMQAWYALRGPVTQPVDTWSFKDIDLFSQCLNACQTNELILDVRALSDKLSNTYATTPLGEASPVVQLMTIHKAKGLEFDMVILPSLHKVTRSTPNPLLLFQEIKEVHPTQYVLAAMPSSDSITPDQLYSYLRHVDSQKAQAEVIRLLYVACTRAKKLLYLSGILQTDQQGELMQVPSNSFLYWLWPALKPEDKKVICIATEPAPAPSKGWLKRIKRKPLKTNETES